MRQKRKATIVQSLSLSLIKTQRNELLLDFLAQNLSFVWVKRPSLNGRHSVRVQKQASLRNLEVWFLNHRSGLTHLKQVELQIWVENEALKQNLKEKRNLCVSRKLCLKRGLKRVYFMHGGLYRKESWHHVFVRFWNDYGLS